MFASNIVEQVSETKYKNLRKIALNLMTIFGSTWICESSFSKLNHIKNKFRTKLTDDYLENILRISCTDMEPDFVKLSRAKQSHFSH